MIRRLSFAVAIAIIVSTSAAFAAERGQPVAGQVHRVDVPNRTITIVPSGQQRWVDLKWTGRTDHADSLEDAEIGQDVFVTARKSGDDEWSVISVQSIN